MNVGEDVELVISGPNLYLPPSNETPPGAGAGRRLTASATTRGSAGAGSGRRPPVDLAEAERLGPARQCGHAPASRTERSRHRPARVRERPHDRHRARQRAHHDGRVPGSTERHLAEYPPAAPSVTRTGDSHVIFIVRDDGRSRDLLVVLPTNTWQAYNYYSGRSLYTYSSRYQNSGSILAATGSERAAKVSLDRPYNNYFADYNWCCAPSSRRSGGWSVTATTWPTPRTARSASMRPSCCRTPPRASSCWAMRVLDEGGPRRGGASPRRRHEPLQLRREHHLLAGAVRDRRRRTCDHLRRGARVLVCYKTIEGGGSSTKDRDAAPPGSGPDTVASQADPVLPTTTFRDPGKGPASRGPARSRRRRAPTPVRIGRSPALGRAVRRR